MGGGFALGPSLRVGGIHQRTCLAGVHHHHVDVLRHLHMARGQVGEVDQQGAALSGRAHDELIHDPRRHSRGGLLGVLAGAGQGHRVGLAPQCQGGGHLERRVEDRPAPTGRVLRTVPEPPELGRSVATMAAT